MLFQLYIAWGILDQPWSNQVLNLNGIIDLENPYQKKKKQPSIKSWNDMTFVFGLIEALWTLHIFRACLWECLFAPSTSELGSYFHHICFKQTCVILNCFQIYWGYVINNSSSTYINKAGIIVSNFHLSGNLGVLHRKGRD